MLVFRFRAKKAGIEHYLDLFLQSSFKNDNKLNFVGNNWKTVAGKKDGQTQVSYSEFDNICKWNFPIDIHLSTTGIQGKFYLENNLEMYKFI